MPLAKTIRSYSELLKMLAELGVAHRPHPDDQTCDVVSEPGLPGPLHIRWEKQLPFVQLIQPIVTAVPAERLRDIEGAVLRLDNAAIFPGIALDHGTGTVYYRVTAVVLVDGVRLDLLQAYISGLMTNARELRRPFLRVLEGLPGDEVLGVAG